MKEWFKKIFSNFKKEKVMIVEDEKKEFEWICLGSFFLRKNDLINVEFFPRESQKVKWRVIWTYYVGETIIENGVEFGKVEEFIKFKEKLTEVLNPQVFEFDDGGFNGYEVEFKEKEDERKRVSNKGN